ncbi:MAG: hypothetical protein ABL867_09295 [Rickettsiales bacterium]
MAEPKKPEPTLEELNASVLSRVTAGVKKANKNSIDAIQKAKNNPVNKGIDPKIFELMIEASNNHIESLIAGAYESSKFELQTTKEGKIVAKQSSMIYENNAEDLAKFGNAVKDETKRLGMAGLTTAPEKNGFNRDLDAAYEAVNREIPKDGVGIFGTIGSAFFDPDKGGIRWGGILGLIGGVVAGVWMGGGLEGGILGIVALAVLAIGGMMLGNFISDAYSDKKEPEKEKGQEKSLKRDTAPKPKVEKDKELNSQIVKLDPSGTTIIYVDKDGKNVPISQGVPANIAELMQIKINSEAGKGLASVAEVALIDKSDGEARPVKMSPKSPVNFKVQKNESNGSYIELGEETVQADLKKLRESVEDVMKNSTKDKSLEQGKDVKTEKTGETSEQLFVDNSLNGYVKSPEYLEQLEKAKKQAGQIEPNGVTITPPDASSIPIHATGEVAQLSTRQR